MANRKKDTTTDTSKGFVVNQLVIKTLNRQTQTIDGWRTALKSADNGRLTLLYNLYTDILTDNVLKNAIGKRIRPITNAGLAFTIDNKEVPEINDLIKTKAFRLLLKEIMLAKMWGVTVLETSFDKVFGVFSVPRTHINTKNKVIGINEGDDFGISYLDDPFLIAVEGEEKFGEILAACPYVIYKRGNFGDWAQFAELFGMPFRLGKYDSFDEAGRIQLTEALDKAGSAAYAAVPKNTDLEYIANNSTGDGALYDNLRKACNEEILIGLLGQTMTSTQGDKGARSLGEVHMEVESGIHADDRIFVETILNTELLPRLEARGFKVAGGSFNYPELGETISLKDRISIDKELDGIVEIEPEYFYETYGIPQPKSGGGKKVPSTGSGTNAPKGTAAEPVEAKPPKEKVKLNDDGGAIELRDEKQFWKGFFDFFAAAPQVGALKVGNHLTNNVGVMYGHDISCPYINLTDTPLFNDDDFFKRFYAEQPDFDVELFNHTAGNLITNFRKGWANDRVKLADIGFDYGFQSEVAQTAMEINLFHFSAAKTLAECQELNKLFRQSKGFDDFLKLAQPKHDIFNKKWAETEYTTANLTAESTATYYRLIEQTDTFPFWCWMTQADGRVRELHVLLHGMILPVNDPRWKKIYPPCDWNDRCYVVPRTRKEAEKVDLKEMRQRADNYINSADFRKAAAQGWGVNRAELKQVFASNQMYLRKFPGKASKELSKLMAADYGLKSISTQMKSALNAVAKYEGEALEWWNAQTKLAGDLVLKDYNNRSLVMSSETFKAQTTAAKAKQTAYLDAMKQTLLNPSEVWLNGQMLDNVVLIKYYTDEVLIVVCRIVNGTVNTVKTWLPLNASKEAINKYRIGMLLQKVE